MTGKSKASGSYQDYLIETLTDPEEAAGYLNAALEGGDLDVFLLALRNVIEAQGGVARVAERAHKGRTSLYKTLSKGGNPHLKNTNDILGALGLRLSVIPTRSRRPRQHL